LREDLVFLGLLTFSFRLGAAGLLRNFSFE
jgi:hypothetical protein